MVKQILTLKRNPGMSFEQFRKYYLEVHAPLVKKHFPEIRKYMVNLALQRGKETPYDAVTEIWWDDIETIIRVAKSDIYRNIIVPDEDKLLDRKTLQVVLTEELLQK